MKMKWCPASLNHNGPDNPRYYICSAVRLYALEDTEPVGETCSRGYSMHAIWPAACLSSCSGHE